MVRYLSELLHCGQRHLRRHFGIEMSSSLVSVMIWVHMMSVFSI